MTSQKLVILMSHLPIVLAVFFAVIRYRHLGSELRSLIPFLVFSLVTQFAALLLYQNGINNMPIQFIHAFLGLILLLHFYHTLFSGYVSGWILGTVAILYTGFCLINVLYFQDVFTFQSNVLVLESVLVIILSLSAFRFLLNDMIREEKKILLPSLSWVVSGLFIYFTSSGLLFYYGEMLSQFSPSAFRMSWMFHSFFFWILYTCIIIGIWKHPSK